MTMLYVAHTGLRKRQGVEPIIMTTWKTIHIVLFTIFTVLLNVAGKLLAVHFQLPLWLDSLGTVQAAFVGGPICGAMVGVTANLAYCTVSRMSALYSITSIAIGVIVGISARRHVFDTFYGFMKVTTLVILVSLLVSLPINMIFSEGYTGNTWGDALIAYLMKRGWPDVISKVLGQLFLEFPDKLVTLLCVYVWARVDRMRRSKEVPTELSGA